MRRRGLKLGLVGVIILEIISLFYLLRIQKKFMANPENYYKNILNRHFMAGEQLKP